MTREEKVLKIIDLFGGDGEDFIVQEAVELLAHCLGTVLGCLSAEQKMEMIALFGEVSNKAAKEVQKSGARPRMFIKEFPLP